MKKILCFGDSNTFGFNPENGKRFDEQTRWAGKLKIALKNKFEVIEKGQITGAALLKTKNQPNFRA